MCADQEAVHRKLLFSSWLTLLKNSEYALMWKRLTGGRCLNPLRFLGFARNDMGFCKVYMIKAEACRPSRSAWCYA